MIKLRKYEKIGLFTFTGVIIVTAIMIPVGAYLSYYNSTNVKYDNISLKNDHIDLEVNSYLDKVDFGPYVYINENESISLNSSDLIVTKPEAKRAALGATYDYIYTLKNNQNKSAIGKAVVSNKFYGYDAEIINGTAKIEDSKRFAGDFQKTGGAVNFRFDYHREGEANLKISLSNGYVLDSNDVEYMGAMNVSDVLNVFVNGEQISLKNDALPEVRGNGIWTNFHELDLGKIYFHAYRNIVTLQFKESNLVTKWNESPRCNIEYIQIDD